MNGLDRAAPATAVKTSERIDALDILRGIALLGMFFVHFNDHSVRASTGFGHVYQRFVELCFADRFWGMFGILFGVGFAVQISRAESDAAVARGSVLRRVLGLLAFVLAAEAFMRYAIGVRFWIMFAILFATGTLVPWRDPFLRRFSRRVAALAAFGVIAEVLFGYWVLFEYAISAPAPDPSVQFFPVKMRNSIPVLRAPPASRTTGRPEPPPVQHLQAYSLLDRDEAQPMR
jgi:uncharacterized membrane protein YeiB